MSTHIIDLPIHAAGHRRTLTIKPGTHVLVREHGVRPLIVHVGEGAQVEWVTLHQAARTAGERSARVFQCATDTRLLIATAVFADIDMATQIQLNGDHAHVEESTVYWASGNEKIALQSVTEHSARYGISKTIIRGIATQHGNATIHGNVIIHQQGSGANGHFGHEGLLVSGAARISAVPALEIQTDDVKASHSSAIHYIQEEQLFYAQTRGIDPEAAKKMIIHGFLGTLLSHIPDTSLRQEFRAMISTKEIR